MLPAPLFCAWHRGHNSTVDPGKLGRVLEREVLCARTNKAKTIAIIKRKGAPYQFSWQIFDRESHDDDIALYTHTYDKKQDDTTALHQMVNLVISTISAMHGSII